MKKQLSMVCVILIMLLTGCSLGGNSYQDGRKCFENDNYEDAALYFASAIDGNPNRAEYYIDYGLTLIKLGRYEEALAEFDQAYVNKEIIIVNRNNKRVHRGRGIAYYYMQEYQKAIEEFQKALKIDALSSLNLDILQYIGSAQMAVGTYEDAIETYTSLLQNNGKSAQAYSSRALCYQYLGEYDKGKKDYDKAISLEPNRYVHYFGEYYLLLESGDTSSADQVLQKASEIEVKTNEDKYQLAKVHFYQEEYDTALAELNDGFANGFREAYYFIGEIYRIMKDYPKAIYYYDIYIKEGSVNSPNVYNQIAVCAMKEEKYDEALAYLEKGMEYHRSNVEKIFLRNEIIAYEHLSEYKKAKVKMKEYLERYPEDQAAAREAEFIDTRSLDAVLPQE